MILDPSNQAFTLKRYPAYLSLIIWMSFVGAAQPAIFTSFVQRKTTAWAIGFNIILLSTVYALRIICRYSLRQTSHFNRLFLEYNLIPSYLWQGVVCSDLIVSLQLWCTEQKGHVFVTMFNPLSTILVALLAYFVLGEQLYIGRYTLLSRNFTISYYVACQQIAESTFSSQLTVDRAPANASGLSTPIELDPAAVPSEQFL